MTATTEAARPQPFSSYLRATARAIAGRQGGAFLLVAAVMTLPGVAAAGVVTRFTWAYIGMLTLTSLLGLGVERLGMLLVAQRGTAAPARALRPLFVIRVALAPVAGLAAWVLFEFVHVRLPVAAVVLTVVWVVAAQLAVVAASGLRTLGNISAEPFVTAVIRASQAAILIGFGAAGFDAETLVAALALVELAGAAALVRALGPGWRGEAPARPSSPLGGWKRAATFAGIETVGLCYLRADLLLVGHVLGAASGATYGLLYRVIDGASGAAGTASLGLFAAAASDRDGGDAPDGARARSLAVLPVLAAALAGIVVVFAGLLGSAIPRLGGETQTLRLLVAATPLLVWNGLELHVRTARGRHAGVLRIGAAAFAVNVGLCIWLVSAHGLLGAAIALLATEVLQTALLVAGARAIERDVVRPSAAVAALATAALVTLAAVM
ncbi:MAG: hypothetical protein WD598_16230 [Acidimicrobiia bacterium]